MEHDTVYPQVTSGQRARVFPPRPYFSGSEDVDEFITALSDVITAYQCEERAQFLLFKCSLQGLAESWFKHIGVYLLTDPEHQFEQAIAALRQAFKPEMHSDACGDGHSNKQEEQRRESIRPADEEKRRLTRRLNAEKARQRLELIQFLADERQAEIHRIQVVASRQSALLRAEYEAEIRRKQAERRERATDRQSLEEDERLEMTRERKVREWQRMVQEHQTANTRTSVPDANRSLERDQAPTTAETCYEVACTSNIAIQSIENENKVHSEQRLVVTHQCSVVPHTTPQNAPVTTVQLHSLRSANETPPVHTNQTQPHNSGPKDAGTIKVAVQTNTPQQVLRPCRRHTKRSKHHKREYHRKMHRGDMPSAPPTAVHQRTQKPRRRCQFARKVCSPRFRIASPLHRLRRSSNYNVREPDPLQNGSSMLPTNDYQSDGSRGTPQSSIHVSSDRSNI